MERIFEFVNSGCCILLKWFVFGFLWVFLPSAMASVLLSWIVSFDYLLPLIVLCFAASTFNGTAATIYRIIHSKDFSHGR